MTLNLPILNQWGRRFQSGAEAEVLSGGVLRCRRERLRCILEATNLAEFLELDLLGRFDLPSMFRPYVLRNGEWGGVWERGADRGWGVLGRVDRWR